MYVARNQKIALCGLGEELGFVVPENKSRQDKQKKVEQILAFVEQIAAVSNRYSASKSLQFVDGAAGSCALSFFVYQYYHSLLGCSVEIKSIDTNSALMDKAANMANNLGFSGMQFRDADILDVELSIRPDVVYALHACDLATDKAIALGIQSRARNILSVSCCQHSFRRRMRAGLVDKLLMKHQIYRDRMTYVVADTMRALLLEMVGYKTSIVEFVSSRATDKNTMVRATLTNLPASRSSIESYLRLVEAYGAAPRLEGYLQEYGLLPSSLR